MSTCKTPQGATLVKGHSSIGHGFNRRIIKNKDWEISAVYDVIFGSRDVDLSDTTLFLTHYPSLDDVKLIVAVGVTTIYFFGENGDPKTNDLINSLPEAAIPLEIIQLR